MIDVGGGSDVENVNSHEKSLDPICRREASLKEKSAHSVVDCTNHTFILPILLGSVWIRKPHLDAIGGTKIMKFSITILTPIVTFKIFNITLKLISDMSSKFNKVFKHIRFMFDRKHPQIMRKLVKK